MKLSESIKPISYLKAHASELINDVAENQKILIITQNGKAKVVVQDIESFEKTRESLALLKMLAQSQKSREEGRVRTVRKAFRDIRNRAEGRRDLQDLLERRLIR